MKKDEFKFRISKELKDLLNSKSQEANMNSSEFLRQFISSSNINVKINNKKDLKELIWNINKIGVNINQLSHGLNYSIQLEKLDSYNYKNLINKLIIIENQLDSILEKEF
ncbi:plasmid mobilization protein [Aliarcobacter cryaerophilus]|uniref:Bacterial mobilisation domain-containing protein n=1 Tax=Aliarcobacter cryaerophilus TaxID=28198 RepID=A0A2S9TD16_9BACT|nr:hypothetical protein [Aliarcobacter cryaerophilus]PRM96735.1 hypothetical protein CJ670_08200 [Arcobacter cryaerophilus gv. crypticus]